MREKSREPQCELWGVATFREQQEELGEAKRRWHQRGRRRVLNKFRNPWNRFVSQDHSEIIF